MTVLAGYLQAFAGFMHSVQGGRGCVVAVIVVIKSILVLNDAVGVTPFAAICVDAASLLAVVKLDSEVVDRYVAVMPVCVDATSLLTVVRLDSRAVAWYVAVMEETVDVGWSPSEVDGTIAVVPPADAVELPARKNEID